VDLGDDPVMDRAMTTIAAAWLVVFAGCGDIANPPPLADARPPPDAPDGNPTAILGRCELADSGADCTGVPDELRVFVALADGDPVRIVTGPQGASMFVLALRTGGMYPGDPDDPVSPDNPEVDILVRHPDGRELARYRGRPVFAVDEISQSLTAPGLFVVLEQRPDTLAGLLVAASATIHDRDGVFRWGEARFTAVR
jgi:hypothetical protein